jgi:hypothetical protein
MTTNRLIDGQTAEINTRQSMRIFSRIGVNAVTLTSLVAPPAASNAGCVLVHVRECVDDDDDDDDDDDVFTENAGL